MVIAWILFGLAGLILLSMMLSQSMIRPYHCVEIDNPGNHGLQFESIEFKSPDGILLRGWWIPAERSVETVVFLHGYHGSKAPDLQYAPLLHNRGYNLLLFDFRGHGSSGGNITSLGALERLDALSAVEAAVRKGSEKIGLLGFSMGGRVAVLAGGESAQVNAIVCDCGPARISTSMELHLQKHGLPKVLSKGITWFVLFGASVRCRVNLFAYEPILQANHLEGKPALFIQGIKDPNICVDETIQMVRNAGSKASLWLVDDAGHRDISDFHPQEYQARLVEFFGQALFT